MSKCIIPWTKAEDEAIIRAIGSMPKSSNYAKTFKEISKRLNRTESAIAQRWYRDLTKNNTTKSTKQTKSNISDKNSSIKELLEYARKHYPVGTVVKSCMSGNLFKLIDNITLNYGDIYATGIDKENPNIESTFCLYCKVINQWSTKVDSTINFPEKESEQQSVEVKEKGIFLNVPKLEQLSINFLKEIASAKIETASKKELIDIIVE